MEHDTKHKLIYDYENDTIAAHCTCGGWAWDEARSRELLPLEAFNAIEADHRRHVEEVEGRSQPQER